MDKIKEYDMTSYIDKKNIELNDSTETDIDCYYRVFNTIEHSNGYITCDTETHSVEGITTNSYILAEIIY